MKTERTASEAHGTEEQQRADFIAKFDAKNAR